MPEKEPGHQVVLKSLDKLATEVGGLMSTGGSYQIEGLLICHDLRLLEGIRIPEGAMLLWTVSELKRIKAKCQGGSKGLDKCFADTIKSLSPEEAPPTTLFLIDEDRGAHQAEEERD